MCGEYKNPSSTFRNHLRNTELQTSANDRKIRVSLETILFPPIAQVFERAPSVKLGENVLTPIPLFRELGHITCAGNEYVGLGSELLKKPPIRGVLKFLW